MIERLVTLCFDRRGIVWLVFAFAALYGVHSFQQLPIEAYPDIADVTSQIVTQVNGLAAEEVEQQITIPIERALLGTPGMQVLRTRSLFGLSLVTVVFQDGVESGCRSAWPSSRCPMARGRGWIPTPRPPAKSTATRWRAPRAACASSPSCRPGPSSRG